MRQGPTDMEGRQERFGTLYHAARPRLVAYALRRTTSPEDAADVVAETFTVAWRRLDDVPDGEAAVLWCYATARRVLANLHRASRRRSQLVERIGAEMATALSSGTEGDPQGPAARRALDRLSDGDRELLMLSGWDGLAAAELACVLGCSVTAVRIRLHRARGRLAAAMADAGMSGEAGRAGMPAQAGRAGMAAEAKQPTRAGHSPDRPSEHHPLTERP